MQGKFAEFAIEGLRGRQQATSQSHRYFFATITAWMSICLFVAGLFPHFGPVLCNTWLVTGAIGLVASIGMTNLLKDEVRSNCKLLREYEIQALLDPMTNLLNRRGFDIELESLVAGEKSRRPRRRERTIFLALIDVDNFKEINDENGHPMGDRMLEFVARTIYDLVPEQSIACRIGGDEFAVIYVDAPPELVAWSLKNIRMSVDHETREREDLIHTTLSIGLTNFQPHDDSESLTSRADLALYRTKAKGRNAISFR